MDQPHSDPSTSSRSQQQQTWVTEDQVPAFRNISFVPTAASFPYTEAPVNFSAGNYIWNRIHDGPMVQRPGETTDFSVSSTTRTSRSFLNNSLARLEASGTNLAPNYAYPQNLFDSSDGPPTTAGFPQEFSSLWENDFYKVFNLPQAEATTRFQRGYATMGPQDPMQQGASGPPVSRDVVDVEQSGSGSAPAARPPPAKRQRTSESGSSTEVKEPFDRLPRPDQILAFYDSARQVQVNTEMYTKGHFPPHELPLDSNEINALKVAFATGNFSGVDISTQMKVSRWSEYKTTRIIKEEPLFRNVEIPESSVGYKPMMESIRHRDAIDPTIEEHLKNCNWALDIDGLKQKVRDFVSLNSKRLVQDLSKYRQEYGLGSPSATLKNQVDTTDRFYNPFLSTSHLIPQFCIPLLEALGFDGPTIIDMNVSDKNDGLDPISGVIGLAQAAYHVNMMSRSISHYVYIGNKTGGEDWWRTFLFAEASVRREFLEALQKIAPIEKRWMILFWEMMRNDIIQRNQVAIDGNKELKSTRVTKTAKQVMGTIAGRRNNWATIDDWVTKIKEERASATAPEQPVPVPSGSKGKSKARE